MSILCGVVIGSLISIVVVQHQQIKALNELIERAKANIELLTKHFTIKEKV